MVVKMSDVAKKAKVSLSTVSKALNNSHEISSEKKQEIRVIAKKLGYRKNALASRLATSKSKTIDIFFYSNGAIQKTESSAFKYISTMIEEIKKVGYDLVLHSIDWEHYNRTFLDICLERKVEGAIFIGFERNNTLLEELINSAIPIVILEGKIQGDNIATVCSDNEMGIELAMQHLFELGHRDIAFVKGYRNLDVSIERFEAYKEKLEGINNYKPEYVFTGDFTFESGLRAGYDISKLQNKPTAVLASSDIMGIGLINAFREKGLKVPEDISVIGYDDFEASKFINPKLTTISQDFEGMARSAMKLLLKMIRNRHENQNITFYPELKIRKSCNEVKKDQSNI